MPAGEHASESSFASFAVVVACCRTSSFVNRYSETRLGCTAEAVPFSPTLAGFVRWTAKGGCPHVNLI